jgi:hypothetical protein
MGRGASGRGEESKPWTPSLRAVWSGGGGTGQGGVLIDGGVEEPADEAKPTRAAQAWRHGRTEWAGWRVRLAVGVGVTAASPWIRRGMARSGGFRGLTKCLAMPYLAKTRTH